MKSILIFSLTLFKSKILNFGLTKSLFLYLFLLIFHISCKKDTALEGDIIITNIKIIDVENSKIQPSKTLIISGDTIRSIVNFNSKHVLNANTIIQGEGKYIMPGLWDMHVHNTGDQLMREAFIPLFNAYGITGIREMSGLPEDFKMKDSIEKKQMIGPKMIMGSPLIDGLSTWNVGSHHLTINTQQEARDIVDSIKEKGYDFIKVYSFLSKENYNAIVHRAKELNIEVSGHIPNDVSAFDAIKAGHKTIEHMIGLEISSNRDELRYKLQEIIQSIEIDTSEDFSREAFLSIEYEPIKNLDPAKEDSLFNLIATSDVWVVPTLVFQKMISYPNDQRFLDDNFKKYIHSRNRDSLIEKDYKSKGRLKNTIDYRMQSLKRLHDKGGKILAGTDINGGITLHVELELMVESGLTPAEALKTATLNPAKYLGLLSEIGTVDEGKVANLVILDDNPLMEILNTRKIRTVINKGEILYRKDLDSMKAKAIQALKENELNIKNKTAKDSKEISYTAQN